MKEKSELAKRIRDLRKKDGLTQAQLAQKIGLREAAVRSYENGLRKPNAQALAALEAFFDVSGDYLLGKTDDRTIYKWHDPEIMNAVKDTFSGLFERVLTATRACPDHDQKMVFDILVELRHLLVTDSLTDAQRAAALDLLQTAFGTSTRFIDTCTASVASSEISRLSRSVDTCVEQYQKALKTAAAVFNASILTLPTPVESIAIYDLPASAGNGQFLDSSDFTMIDFPIDTIPRSTSFGVRIRGDSMIPAIKDGEIVFVKRQPALLDGEIGIFALNGDVFCKRYRRSGEDVFLESDNKDNYQPIHITETDNLRLLGLVIGHSYL